MKEETQPQEKKPLEQLHEDTISFADNLMMEADEVSP